MNQNHNKNNKNIKTSRIIKKIRNQNKDKDSLIYKIAFYSMIFIGVFVVVTTILQINWFAPNETPMPLITWIIAQPYVGVFFLPFLILAMFISTWLSQLAKPVSIKNVLNDLTTLYECEQISQDDYDLCFEQLKKAYKNKMNADEEKAKTNNLKKQFLLEEIEKHTNNLEGDSKNGTNE